MDMVVYNNSNYSYSHNNYSHSKIMVLVVIVDGSNTLIYTWGLQLLRDSDEDLDLESLYYLHSLEYSHFDGTWFDPRYPPIGSIRVGVETHG